MGCTPRNAFLALVLLGPLLALRYALLPREEGVLVSPPPAQAQAPETGTDAGPGAPPQGGPPAPADAPGPDPAAGLPAPSRAMEKQVRQWMDRLRRARERGGSREMQRIYENLRGLGAEAVPGLLGLLEASGDEVETLLLLNALDGMTPPGPAAPAWADAVRRALFEKARFLLRGRGSVEGKANAVSVLVRNGGEAAAPLLLEAAEQDPSPAVRGYALDGLERAAGPDTARRLVRALDEKRLSGLPTRVRAARTALHLLRATPDEAARARLDRALRSELRGVLGRGDEKARAQHLDALSLLGSLAGPDANPDMRTVLRTGKSLPMIRTALDHLRAHGAAASAEPELRRLASDPSAGAPVRALAQQALDEMK